MKSDLLSSPIVDAPQTLSVLLWHKKEWELLCQRVNAHHLPHAFLLAGQEGIGKSEFARCAASYLLCLYPDKSQWCGKCRSCHLLSVGNHPDFIGLTPEESHIIKIDAIRNMINAVANTPQISSRKVVVITPAEAMNTASYSALLKTLEEPPANTILFLVSHHPHLLPLTIRSRCQTILFNLTNTKQFLDAEQWQWRQDFLTDVVAMMSRNTDPVLVAQKYHQSDLKLVFTVLHNFIMDIIRLQFVKDIELINNPDFRADMVTLSSRLSVEAGFHFESKLQSLKKGLLSGINLNKQLTLEDLLIDLYQGVTA